MEETKRKHASERKTIRSTTDKSSMKIHNMKLKVLGYPCDGPLNINFFNRTVGEPERSTALTPKHTIRHDPKTDICNSYLTMHRELFFFLIDR
jgi:hypothetical protein